MNKEYKYQKPEVKEKKITVHFLYDNQFIPNDLLVCPDCGWGQCTSCPGGSSCNQFSNSCEEG